MPLDFNLYLITDRHQVPPGRTLVQTVEAALSAGVRAVQLREKDLSAAELLPLARELRALTLSHDARLLINGDLALALKVDADGVHLPSQTPDIAAARRLLGPDRLIGVSTHSLAEIEQAAAQGADFATFSPVYATPSKAAFGPPQGLDALTAACQASTLPVFALGGITAERVAEVRAAGAFGVALIAAIIAADDPEKATRRFLT